jgi:hypothetical protein
MILMPSGADEISGSIESDDSVSEPSDKRLQDLEKHRTCLLEPNENGHSVNQTDSSVLVSV